MEIVVERVRPENHFARVRRRPCCRRATAHSPSAPTSQSSASRAEASRAAAPGGARASPGSSRRARSSARFASLGVMRSERRPFVDQSERIGLERRAGVPRNSARETPRGRSRGRRSSGTPTCTPCTTGTDRAPLSPPRSSTNRSALRSAAAPTSRRARPRVLWRSSSVAM